MALFALLLPPQAGAAKNNATTLLRAAYVLRALEPGAAWEPIVIPRHIITDDMTNILITHSDRVFVLNAICSDLYALTRNSNETAAWYYAAHANRMRGNMPEAAAQMSRYVLLSPYNPANYRFILRCLYENGEYQAMRDMADQWRAINSECDDMRLTYVWGSHFAEQNHVAAINAALRDTCTGWLPQVLAAKSKLELEDEKNANAIIALQLLQFPKNAAAIRMLWHKLQYAKRYP